MDKCELIAEIRDADMVLAGIGKELEQKYKEETEKQYQNGIGESDSYTSLAPFLYQRHLREHPDQKIMDCLGELSALLSGKNYFVVSLSTDDLIYRIPFREDRIVTPCGGYRNMQCSRNCSGKLIPFHNNDSLSISEPEKFCPPKCPECGAPLLFNTIASENYLEEGYLKQWKLYQHWLQGTLNKKLLLLELGAGLEYPSVIRWPFEKMAYFNQKAHLIRVHSRLYQITEEIAGRAVSVRENPAEFLLQQVR